MTRRVQIILSVDDDEPEAFERWRAAWAADIVSVEDAGGCGCCVDILDVEATERAFAALRRIVPDALD